MEYQKMILIPLEKYNHWKNENSAKITPNTEVITPSAEVITQNNVEKEKLKTKKRRIKSKVENSGKKKKKV